MSRQRIPGLIVAASVALAPLSFTSITAAQPAATAPAGKSVGSTTVGEVVVRGGKKATPSATFEREASGFVMAQSQPSHLGLLARYMTPVCPTVVGLTPQYADYVAKRITEVAARAGAPHGRCTHMNVRVVFTTQPQKLMDYVREKLPDVLGYHDASDEKTLATFQGPIDVWHDTGTLGDDGSGFKDDSTNQKNPGVAFGDSYGVSSQSASRLRGAASSEFLFALVVVDSNQVEKLPIGRIADQIAMMVLTNPRRPRTCSPLPTLLDSLDPDCPASATLVSFSPYDEALLSGLYASDSEEKGAIQRSEVAGRIEANGPPPAAEGKDALAPITAPNRVNAVWRARS